MHTKIEEEDAVEEEEESRGVRVVGGHCGVRVGKKMDKNGVEEASAVLSICNCE